MRTYLTVQRTARWHSTGWLVQCCPGAVYTVALALHGMLLFCLLRGAMNAEWMVLAALVLGITVIWPDGRMPNSKLVMFSMGLLAAAMICITVAQWDASIVYPQGILDIFSIVIHKSGTAELNAIAVQTVTLWVVLAVPSLVLAVVHIRELSELVILEDTPEWYELYESGDERAQRRHSISFLGGVSVSKEDPQEVRWDKKGSLQNELSNENLKYLERDLQAFQNCCNEGYAGTLYRILMEERVAIGDGKDSDNAWGSHNSRNTSYETAWAPVGFLLKWRCEDEKYYSYTFIVQRVQRLAPGMRLVGTRTGGDKSSSDKDEVRLDDLVAHLITDGRQAKWIDKCLTAVDEVGRLGLPEEFVGVTMNLRDWLLVNEPSWQDPEYQELGWSRVARRLRVSQ